MKRLVALASLAGILAACSSTANKPVSAPSVQQQAAPAPAAATQAVQETEAQKLARVAKTLSEKSVFFDFDDYTIKPEYQDLIKQDYQLLRSVPKHQFRLEGNADERGSTEYNIALGQKRAEAVRRALVIMGVPDSQLEAVSYGKEKPRATCHEETCWSQNRRVDVVPKS